MKKLLIGSSIGVVLGVGATLGLAQIPDVAGVIGLDKNTNHVVDEDKVTNLENENNQLNNQINILNTELDSCKTQIIEKDNQIKLKNDEITILIAEKAELQTQLDDVIAENESMKELVGSDTSQLLSTISSLTTQLEEKTSQLISATAELEQLRVDKETLSSRVVELETRLAETQEELAKYKSLGDIDVLKIDNFNGTWYVNGTFEDYYIIKDGVVTHNASEDTGVIQCLNNQVYLFMNNAGSIPVNLSVDGASFSLSDETIYSKFYINTEESYLTNLSSITGDYLHEDTKITINLDNTISISNNDGVYYGAYTVSSIKKNVGGNVCITNYITANVNLDDTQVVYEYSIVTGQDKLIDSNGVCYSLVYQTPFILSNSSTSSFTIPTGGVKVTVKTNTPIAIASGNSVVVLGEYLSLTSDNYSRITSPAINGARALNNSTAFMSNMSQSVTLYNSSSEDVVASYFDFYISTGNYCFLQDIKSIDGVLCTIVDVEITNVTNFTSPFNGTSITKGSKIYTYYEMLQNFSSSNQITCGIIEDYINSSYDMDGTALDITSDGAIITAVDTDPIIASEITISAKTDGYDIYQTATIKYVTHDDGTDTTHIIIINYKNNDVVNSTLDSVEIDIIKN